MSYVLTIPRRQYTLGASTAKKVAATAVSSVPVVGPIIGGLINLISGNPHGDCATYSQSLDQFLSCWKHEIPNGKVPLWTGNYWGGPKQDQWPCCAGATGGRPPSGGCASVYPDGSTCVNGVLVAKNGQPVTSKSCGGSCPEGKGATGNPCLPAGTTETLYGGGVNVSPVSTATNFLTTPLAGVPAWTWIVGVVLLLLGFLL